MFTVNFNKELLLIAEAPSVKETRTVRNKLLGFCSKGFAASATGSPSFATWNAQAQDGISKTNSLLGSMWSTTRCLHKRLGLLVECFTLDSTVHENKPLDLQLLAGLGNCFQPRRRFLQLLAVLELFLRHDVTFLANEIFLGRSRLGEFLGAVPNLAHASRLTLLGRFFGIRSCGLGRFGLAGYSFGGSWLGGFAGDGLNGHFVLN